MTVYRVELFLNGAWVNVTNIGGQSYLAAELDGSITPVSIVRGRQDWKSDVDVGTCTFTLLDDDPPSGRWSPDNPTGPYFGQLGVNTPVRVIVTYSAVDYTRFVGELSSVGPPQWDTAGARVVYPCEAAGVLRRLGKWSDPIRSVLRREIPRFANVRAYWPCEDKQGCVRIAAGLDTHRSMGITGHPDCASHSGFDASKPILTLRDADLHGKVPWYSYTGGASVWQVGFLLHVGESGSTDGQTILHVVTDENARRWEIQYLTANGGSLRLRVVNENENQLLLTGAKATGINDDDLHVTLRATRSGSNINWNLHTLTPGGLGDSWSGSIGGNVSLGRVIDIRVNYKGGHDDVAVGHIYVLSAAQSFLTISTALAAHEYEPAGRRIERLCSEKGVTFLADGNLDDTARLGPQRVDSFLNLVREAARSDGGILCEPTTLVANEPPLGYRTGATLWSQTAQIATVYTSRHLSEPLEPVPDDQDVVNDVTVSGPRGEAHVELASGRLSVAKPPAGVGRIAAQVDVNVPDDAMESYAHWHLTRGTVEGVRYPQIRFDVGTNPNLSGLAAAILSADLGDRLTITSMPVWTTRNTVTQLIEGVAEEELTPFEHSVTFFCSPEAPYHGGIFDNAGSRFDADSTLAAGVTSGATSLSVATVGPLWTTNVAGEGQFDVMVGGERIRVTAVSGTSSPQTFTVTRSQNGVVKGHSSGAALNLADPVRFGLGSGSIEDVPVAPVYGPQSTPGIAGAVSNPDTVGYTEVRKAAGTYNAQTVTAGTFVLPEVGAEGQVTFTGQTSFGAGSVLYGITLNNTATQWTARVQATDVRIEHCDFTGNPTIEHIRWEQSGMALRACKFTGNPTNHTVKVDGRTTLTGGGVITDCEFGGNPLEDAIQCEGQTTTTIEYCSYVGTPGEDYNDIKQGDAVVIRGIDFTSATSREAVLAQNDGGVTVTDCRFGANCFASFGANLISVIGSITNCVFTSGSTLRLRKSFDVEVTALTMTSATIVLGTSTADDYPRLANIHHNSFTNLTITIGNASSTTITNNNTYAGATTGTFPSGNN